MRKTPGRIRPRPEVVVQKIEQNHGRVRGIGAAAGVMQVGDFFYTAAIANATLAAGEIRHG
jgi:hypothetical protein